MIFEGAKVQFIPAHHKWSKEGQPDAKAVTGKISKVNWQNRVFFVEYKSGDTIQTEAFQFYDIGKSVKILGR
jgi:hypothetical protein